MNPTPRIGDEATSTTPQAPSTADPFLGANFQEMFCDMAEADWQAFEPHDQVGSPPSIESLPSADITDSYSSFNLFDDEFSNQADLNHISPAQRFEDIDPQEATEVVDNPKKPAGLIQSMNHAFESEGGEGEMPPPSSKSPSIIGPYPSDPGSTYFQCTNEDTLITVPAMTYRTPLSEVDQVNNAPHPSSDRQNRKLPKSMYMSKEKARRAKLEANGVEIGQSGHRLGNVDIRNGALHVELGPNQWARAIYHHQIRAELVAQAPPQLYRHLPASGSEELDVTTFYEPHKGWGFKDRKDRPDVCFEWVARKGTVQEQPKMLKHRGLIVLDVFTNKPIRDWPIPSCLSSKIEGGRLEAMRREVGLINKEDFRARMPHKVLGQATTTEGALAMRMTRFREDAGLPSANPRPGSEGKKRALIQCYPVRIMEEILITNSTRRFRDLNRHETTYIGDQTRGCMPAKAGGRALTNDERKKANEKKNKTIRGYQPVNPNAEPFGADVEDDWKAIDVARTRRGLEPLGLPKDEARVRLKGQVSGRKRSRDDEAGVSEGPESAPKMQRLGINGDVEAARGSTRQPQPTNQSYTPNAYSGPGTPFESEPTPMGYRLYAGAEISGQAGSIGVSDTPPWVTVTDMGHSALPIQEESAHPVNFAEFEASNNSNWNSSLNPDPPLSSTYEETWYPAASNPSMASHTPESMRGLDYRFAAPIDAESASIIAFFLRVSISNVMRYVGVQPPYLPYEESYMTQWHTLWTWYTENCPIEPPPPIWQCTEPWYGWPSKELREN
ncbi:MAG: hypothetical protein Q9209_002974 [Squamulea sp. 1 TL-2023]